MNVLGKTLGYHKNDAIVSINGVVITAANANDFFKNFGTGSKTGDSLTISVLRNNVPVELKGTMMKFPIMKNNVLRFNNSPSEEQVMLRNAWLKAKA